MEPTQAFDLPSVIQQNLNRDNLQQLGERAERFAKENPLQAAGLVAVAGLALYGLIGTKPGRQLVKAGSTVAMPIVTNWIANNYEQFI